MSGYEKERSLFYHLIIWIGWIKVFLQMKKVAKQFMKMMVPQIVELVGVQVMLHKNEISIPIIKVRLLEQFLQVLAVMMVTIGAVGGVVALVRVLDEMVALGAVILVE